MKRFIVILAAFFALLAVDMAVESATATVETSTTQGYSLSSPDDMPQRNHEISLSAATIPVSAVADLRNSTNPDCRTAQRNVRSAIGDLIKEASYFSNTLSAQNEELHDGTPCNETRYRGKYYIFATRHILI